MKKHNALFLAGSFMLAFSACDSTKQTTTEPTTTPNTAETVNQQPAPATAPATGAMEKDGLKVYSFNDSPKFADAALRMVEPLSGTNLPSGAVQFNYELTNFKLTEMTGHDHSKEMANSM